MKIFFKFFISHLLQPFFHDSMKWTDGSMESDLPMERLSEMFNVNHFIVSQVQIALFVWSLAV